MEHLRQCRKCGLTATTGEELELFTNALKCPYGKANFCKRCEKIRNLVRRGYTETEAEAYVCKQETATHIRECRDCGVKAFTTNDLLNFSTKSTALYGVESQCKVCRGIEKQANRYKVSKDFIIKVFTEQPVCVICSSPDNLVYDHCHTIAVGEKAFRGILCGNCNSGLGYFKDNTKLLQNAVTYLNNFNLSSFG